YFVHIVVEIAKVGTRSWLLVERDDEIVKLGPKNLDEHPGSTAVEAIPLDDLVLAVLDDRVEVGQGPNPASRRFCAEAIPRVVSRPCLARVIRRRLPLGQRPANGDELGDEAIVFAIEISLGHLDFSPQLVDGLLDRLVAAE